MYCTRQITDSITWVGGSDRRLALFENLFPVPRGIAYNSYLIQDDKTALIDTVDSSITRQFLDNVSAALDGRQLDYLVINHMEPDHCANIEELLLRYPSLTMIGNDKTLSLFRRFYNPDWKGRAILVKEGDTLPLGRHTLHFYFAPMVHWPEVMMCYEEKEGLLFSADAFGSFGALSGNIFDDEVCFGRDWLADTRRYYTNIVGKYGLQVHAALKKLEGLPVRMLCPLHGIIWRANPSAILDKYDAWSHYDPEERAIAFFYGSMYGNTENAVNILAAMLADAGEHNLTVYDASGTHVSTLIAEAFRCSHLVFAVPTYNGGIYPPMLNLLHDMKALNLQNRTIALIDNGSWAPAAARQVRDLLDGMKRMRILDPVVSIQSTVKPDTLASLKQLKESILSSLAETPMNGSPE